MTTLDLTKSIRRSPLRHGLFLIAIALACSALVSAPKALAVSPTPDGGYPGNNTAEGTSALSNLTSGISNTALGYQALYSENTGNYNTANGAQAMQDNRGVQNTVTGSSALLSNINGSYNTVDGTMRSMAIAATTQPSACGHLAPIAPARRTRPLEFQR
jgi:hypothetical protein